MMALPTKVRFTVAVQRGRQGKEDIGSGIFDFREGQLGLCLIVSVAEEIYCQQFSQLILHFSLD